MLFVDAPVLKNIIMKKTPQPQDGADKRYKNTGSVPLSWVGECMCITSVKRPHDRNCRSKPSSAAGKERQKHKSQNLGGWKHGRSTQDGAGSKRVHLKAGFARQHRPRLNGPMPDSVRGSSRGVSKLSKQKRTGGRQAGVGVLYERRDIV